MFFEQFVCFNDQHQAAASNPTRPLIPTRVSPTWVSLPIAQAAPISSILRMAAIREIFSPFTPTISPCPNSAQVIHNLLSREGEKDAYPVNSYWNVKFLFPRQKFPLYLCLPNIPFSSNRNGHHGLSGTRSRFPGKSQIACRSNYFHLGAKTAKTQIRNALDRFLLLYSVSDIFVLPLFLHSSR